MTPHPKDAKAGDEDYQAQIRVDTAMILIVDPCQLPVPPDHLAQLVRERKAALVAVQMDGWYTATIDTEAVGLVVDVDPESSDLVRPGEAFEMLSMLQGPET